jgi:hypothetical protein
MVPHQTSTIMVPHQFKEYHAALYAPVCIGHLSDENDS